MNEKRRGVYIAVAVVLIAGSFLWIFISNGKLGKGRGKGGSIMGTMEFPETEVRSLRLKLGGCQAEIREGDTFSLKYQEVYEDCFKHELKDGKLLIQYEGGKKNSVRLLGLSGVSAPEAKLELTIPKGMVFEQADMEFGAAEIRLTSVTAKELSISIGAGELKAEQLLVTEKTSLKVGAGSMNLRDSSIANVTADCGVGELQYEGEISGDSQLKCGVGELSMKLSGCSQEDFFGRLKCGLGEIDFGDIAIQGSGNKTFGKEGTSRFDAECGIGEIKVVFR